MGFFLANYHSLTPVELWIRVKYSTLLVFWVLSFSKAPRKRVTRSILNEVILLHFQNFFIGFICVKWSIFSYKEVNMDVYIFFRTEKKFSDCLKVIELIFRSLASQYYIFRACVYASKRPRQRPPPPTSKKAAERHAYIADSSWPILRDLISIC